MIRQNWPNPILFEGTTTARYTRVPNAKMTPAVFEHGLVASLSRAAGCDAITGSYLRPAESLEAFCRRPPTRMSHASLHPKNQPFYNDSLFRRLPKKFLGINVSTVPLLKRLFPPPETAAQRADRMPASEPVRVLFTDGGRLDDLGSLEVSIIAPDALDAAVAGALTDLPADYALESISPYPQQTGRTPGERRLEFEDNVHLTRPARFIV